MTKKTKLIWRLREKPTTESLQELVKSNILTKDEARDILFNLQTSEDRDKKSLESEIKFLRELVEKLSKSNSRIVEVIREVERPAYRTYPWWGIYDYWCNPGYITCGSTSVDTCGGTFTTTDYGATTTSCNFSDISTF